METNPVKATTSQEASNPHGVMIFSIAGLERHNYAAYPIFSLHKTDQELIEETRSLARMLNIEHSEIDLPGVDGPEIGFVMSWNDTVKLRDYLDKRDDEDNPAAIDDQFSAWLVNPITTPLPAGVTIPENCYQPYPDCLQEKANEGNEDERGGTAILLNVPTGERVRVKYDFARKTYKIEGDITGWLHIASLPDFKKP